MMGLELAEAVVAIKGDKAPLARALRGAEDATNRAAGAMQKRLNRLANTFGRVGKAMTIGVTLPIVGGFGAAIKVASDAEETATKFAAVFQDLQGPAQAWVNEQTKALELSQTKLKDYISGLHDTFVPMGMMEKESFRLSKSLTKLGIDLSSFYNMPVEEAIQRMTSAIVGNHEAVRSFGITITEQRLKQKIYKEGWASTSKEITAQMKVMARYKLIMEGTERAQGDFQRTQKGFANQWRILKDQVLDATAALGRELLPIAKDLIGQLKSVVQWVGEWSRSTRQTALKIAALTASIGPLLIVLEKLIKLRAALAISNIASGATGAAGALGGLSGVVSNSILTLAGLKAALIAVGAVLAPLAAGVAILGTAIAGLWAGNKFGKWLAKQIPAVDQFYKALGRIINRLGIIKGESYEAAERRNLGAAAQKARTSGLIETKVRLGGQLRAGEITKQQFKEAMQEAMKEAGFERLDKPEPTPQPA